MYRRMQLTKDRDHSINNICDLEGATNFIISMGIYDSYNMDKIFFYHKYKDIVKVYQIFNCCDRWEVKVYGYIEESIFDCLFYDDLQKDLPNYLEYVNSRYRPTLYI